MCVCVYMMYMYMYMYMYIYMYVYKYIYIYMFIKKWIKIDKNINNIKNSKNELKMRLMVRFYIKGKKIPNFVEISKQN